MSYPKPTRFIRFVADKSRCAAAGGADSEIDEALDWLREQIVAERERQEAGYEREEAKSAGADDY